MLSDLTAQDMAGAVDELLAIKYRRPRTRPLVARLLGKAASKTIVLEMADDAPIVIEFRPDGYRVTTTSPARFDMRIVVPMRELMTMFTGRLPLGALLRGRIRFRGSPRDALILQKLLYVPIGDRQSALTFFRHYFLEM